MKAAILSIFLLLKLSTLLSQTDTTATEFEYGKLGIGVELGPCTGKFFNTGQAKEYIQDGWCYANVGLGVSYKKTHYIAQFGGISGSLLDSLYYDSRFKKGNNFGTMHLQLAVGYEVLNTKRINIIPYISAGGKVFNSKVDSTGATNYATGWSPVYAIGSAFDLKMHFPIREKNRFPGYEYYIQYLYIRLITGISPNYYKSPLDVSGTMYFVNLSIGTYVKPSKEKN